MRNIRSILKENKSTRLKTALFNRGNKVRSFAILTAENPMGKSLTADKNNARMKKLYEILKQNRLNYIKVIGQFGNKEHSVMIINLSYGDAEYLAKMFGQLSFFFGNNEGISYYEATDETGEQYRKVETTNRVDSAKDADDFFSRYGDFKFSIYLNYFNDNSPDIADEKAVEESIDDTYNRKDRIAHRKLIYPSIEGLDENKSTRLKSALFNRGGKVKTFAILTAENPMKQLSTAEDNNKNTKKLKEYLRKMGLNYVPVEGRYGNKEHSFLIVNLAYKDAEFLAETFEQESFFFGDENGIHYYQWNGNGYSLVETSNRIDTVQDADDFFSRHGDFKFSIYMDIFNESIDDVDEASLDNNRTIWGRRIHRMKK